METSLWCSGATRRLKGRQVNRQQHFVENILKGRRARIPGEPEGGSGQYRLKMRILGLYEGGNQIWWPFTELHREWLFGRENTASR